MEFAVSLPLLLIATVGAFELGRAVHQYLALSQIVYEGARAGSQLIPSEIAVGCHSRMSYSILTDPDHINDHEYNSVREVLQRVNHLLAIQSDSLSIECEVGVDPGCERTPGQPNVSAEYIPAAVSGQPAPPTCGNAANARNSFAVRVSGLYRPLIFPFPIRVSVESRAGILFGNEQFSTRFEWTDVYNGRIPTDTFDVGEIINFAESNRGVLGERIGGVRLDELN